jgi:CRP-like cAMP-binding protein/Fe-S-cluster-containing hydrogenase component 2
MISCPTDALTFRGLPTEVQDQPRPRGTFEISATELKQLPLFSGIPLKFLQWNSGAVSLRRLKQGEVLFQEGDYGSTAFILLSGQYEVSIRTPFSHIESRRPGGLRGWFGSISNRLSHDTSDNAQQYIPVDGGAPLPYGKPVAIRTADDVILGEMTCMNHYPRSATVVVKESGEALEIRRNVLYALQRNSVARQILDRVYRERVLGDHLRTLSLFKDLSDAERRLCAQFLKHKVDLIRVDPGQVIFRQGEPADHFYMVRLGFVKVTQNYPGGERVLDYLGPGRHFGEIGLLSALAKFSLEGIPAGYQGMRTATCAALDDVELVRIRGEHFRELVNALPTFRDKILQQSKELLAKDEAARGQVDQSLEEFLDQGLFNAQKLLVLDLEACTRCDECTRACADTHDGVTRLIREGLRFDKYLIASSCRSCLDPYCLVGCPVDAIHRQGSLEIVIENHCIGCGLCASNCPYGNINMHAKPEERSDPRNPGRMATVLQQKATTCDLCRNVVGPNQDPSCVYACPHNAAFRKSGRELLTMVRRT